jgi:hypothetical protein
MGVADERELLLVRRGGGRPAHHASRGGVGQQSVQTTYGVRRRRPWRRTTATATCQLQPELQPASLGSAHHDEQQRPYREPAQLATPEEINILRLAWSDVAA